MPRASAVDRVQDVYAASYRRLVGQLTGVTGDPAEAEDVVMEAFARAVNSHRSFLAADNPEAWLRTAAVDVARTRWRRARLSRNATPRLVALPGSYADLPADRLALLAALRAVPHPQREEPPMILPADLQHEIAERADPPGFDEVVVRASAARRRRRTTTVSGLAAVCVVGGVLVALWPTPAPEEPAPEPIVGTVDERLPDEVQQLLQQERIDPWQVSGSGGAIAALWSACGGDERCRFAVVTRLGDRVTGSLLEGPSPAIAEVPDGWLVQDGSGTFRLSSDGARTPVIEPGGNPVPVEAGDTAVATTDGWRLLRGDKLIPVPTPDGSEALAAHVTPAGDLVAATSPAPGTVEVSWTDAGGGWRTGYVPRTSGPASGVVLAGHHDAVAVAVLGDTPDGAVPVLDVALSGDAGRTWTAARGLPTGLRDLSALATSDEGTAYLTTGSHGTVRVDAQGNAFGVSQSSHDRSAFQVSHRVCLVTENGRVDVLRCSADDGTTWAAMSLPGFR